MVIIIIIIVIIITFISQYNEIGFSQVIFTNRLLTPKDLQNNYRQNTTKSQINIQN